MCHTWQLEDALRKGDGAYNFDYALAPVRKYIQAADFAIGNLETVLAGQAVGYSDFPLFNSPDEYAYALKNAGFDFVTTANNHCNDKGMAGLLRTLAVLDQAGLGHAGTYATPEARREIYTAQVNGITFALVPFTYGINGTYLPQGKEYMVSFLKEDAIREDLAAAKALGPDVVIALPHMGDEYATQPRSYFKNLARLMLEAGADVVLASHPHVLQPAEWVTLREEGRARKCFVAYSMGNFISSQRTLPRDAGGIFNLFFEKTQAGTELTAVTFTPTWVKFINDRGVYDIQTLAVYDILQAQERGEATGLRAGDLNRARRVWQEAERLFSAGALQQSKGD
jgi:poly-gamma-glutamate synthesis protein (capsule biosynthesis protein)